MAVVFGDLPKELQDNCVLFLDPTSVGRVAQVSKACWAIADAHLDAAKAAFAAAPFEKSQHGSIRTYRNPSDGSKLITFSLIDGGQARTQRFVCSCTPNTERVVGQAFSAVVRHMASRDHWNHWRLVAFGEAQPTEAAWVAYQATLPGWATPMRRH